MTHPPSRWCSPAGYEANDRLGHVLPGECRCLLLVAATDFTDYANGMCLGVVLKSQQAIHKAGSNDRVAAYADAGALSNTGTRKLIYDLISEGTRATYHAHWTLYTDLSRNDADLAAAG
jgi:hypothetical protein